MYFQSGLLIDERYQLLEEIGNGGMAMIWRAQDIRQDLEVAIKFMKSDSTQNYDKLKEYFDREVQLNKQIRQFSGFVPLLDSGIFTVESQNYPYFVMVYVPSDLSKSENITRLQQNFDHCLIIAIEICEAIKVLHDRRIAHRDIKPSNILLDIFGKPKLADFGISKKFETASPYLQSGGRGTPGFQAPETSKSKEFDVFLADIFSLGVTFYVTLTGAMPYGQEGTNLGSALNAIRSKKHRIPIEVSELICRMIAIDPANRPKNIQEVLAVLNNVRIRFDIENQKNSEALQIGILRRIRQLISDKADRIFSILGSNKILKPNFDESPHWYVDLLLRRTNQAGKLEPQLFPIKCVHFERGNLLHVSDWLEDDYYFSEAIDLDHTCCGIPIRMLEGDAAVIDQIKLLEASHDVIYSKSTEGLIEYLVIRNVNKLRFGEPTEGGNIVRNRYATDFSNDDWPIGIGRTLRSSDGTIHRRERDVHVEVIIPLYDGLKLNSLSEDSHGFSASDDDLIVGLLNLEWVAPLKPDRLDRICKNLSKWFQKENAFPISIFLAEIMQLATSTKAELSLGARNSKTQPPARLK